MTGKNKNERVNAEADIEYGTVNVDLSNLQPHEIKIRISTMLDEDVLLKLKEIAKDTGAKYQTLLNAVLRSFVEAAIPVIKKRGNSKMEDTVRRIVRAELRKRA